MSVLDRLAKRFGFTRTEVAAAAEWAAGEAALLKEMKALPPARTFDTTSQELPRLLQLGGPSTSGKSVSSDTAMQHHTVFTCTRIISETLGSVPGAMYEGQPGDENAKKIEHDLAGLLFEQPNSEMDGIEFVETYGVNLCLEGNQYYYKNTRSTGEPTSLWPINPYACQPFYDEPSGELKYKVLDRGKWETVGHDKVWHIKGFGSNGLVGFSPVGYQRNLLGMAIATEEFQAKFFANGANPSWIISLPGWLDRERRGEEREAIQKWWGPGNAYKPQILEGGMTATAATMPLVDAQFLELSKKSRGDIFGMYRVPPHLGGDLERSTNNNIEQQSLEFLMYCMLSYFRRFEMSARRWLLKPADRRKYFLRFNLEGLLRADSAARGALYNMLLQNGVLNRNEVRALENRPRSEAPGMDDYTVQTALTPIDMLRKQAERAAEPKPAPVIAAPGASPEKPAEPGGLPLKAFGDVHISLPESLKHMVHAEHGIPGLSELVDVIATTAQKNTAAADMLRNEVNHLSKFIDRMAAEQDKKLDAFVQGVKDIAALAGAERELVFDNHNNPVGNRIKQAH